MIPTNMKINGNVISLSLIFKVTAIIFTCGVAWGSLLLLTRENTKDISSLKVKVENHDRRITSIESKLDNKLDSILNGINDIKRKRG